MANDSAVAAGAFKQDNVHPVDVVVQYSPRLADAALPGVTEGIGAASYATENVPVTRAPATGEVPVVGDI